MATQQHRSKYDVSMKTLYNFEFHVISQIDYGGVNSYMNDSNRIVAQ